MMTLGALHCMTSGGLLTDKVFLSRKYITLFEFLSYFSRIKMRETLREWVSLKESFCGEATGLLPVC